MDSFNTPIAESTHIGPSSPRTSIKRKQEWPLNNPRRVIRSASCSRVDQRIDPHVITDSQSNGLVSRIVGYYEKSQSEMERSRVTYNRAGDFPIVHLIKHAPPKVQTMKPSSIRIAPPNKTVFNKNFRASVMNQSQLFQPVSNPNLPNQSGLTMMRKSASQKALNEPLSPHINEIVDYGANRSVLDALKEVSRKRINSEEMELDRTKKMSKDSYDGPETSSYLQTGCQKRPRDIPLFPHSDLYFGANSKRKRVSNNDILSSLSSSKKLNRSSSESNLSIPLRSPIYENYPAAVFQPSPERQAVKTAELFKVATTPEYCTPPIDFNLQTPSKPLIQNVRNLSLFNNRGMSAQDNEMLCNDDPILTRTTLRSPDPEDQRINFILPKFKALEPAAVKQASKSKLSMMLKCLSGLDEEEKPKSIVSVSKDVVDMKETSVSEVPTNIATSQSTTSSLSFGTTTTSTIQSPISTPAISTNAINSSVSVVKESTETTSSSKETDSTEAFKDTTPLVPLVIPTSSVPSISTSLVTSTTTTASFQFGMTSKPIISSSIPSSVSSTVTSFLNKPTDVIATPVKSTASTNPLLGTPVSTGGISMFGTITPASIIDPNKSLISFGTPVKPVESKASSILGIGTNSPLAGFSFGNKSVPEITKTTSALSLPVSTVSTAPTFKFGMTPAVAPVVPETKAPATISGFSFGNIQKPAEVASTSFLNTAVPVTYTPKPSLGFTFGQTPIVPAPISAASSFDFGTPKTPQAQSTQAQPIGVIGSSIFGNSNTTALPIIPTLQTGNGFSFGKTTNVVSPSIGGFKFAGTDSNSTNSVALNNSINLMNTSNVPAKGGFSFSATTPIVTPAQPAVPSFTGFQQPNAPVATNSGGFNFGQAATPIFGATTNSTPIFGATTNNSAPQQPQKENMFSFGQKPAATASSNLFDSKPSSTFNFQAPQSAEPPKTSFSFGATPIQQAQTAPAATGMFSFNSNAVSNNASNASSSMFSFSNNNNTSGSTGNLAPANNGDVSASFTFKAPSSNNLSSTSGIFGQQNQAATPAFSFGTTDANKTFSGFGGTSEVKTNLFSNQAPQSQTTMSASFNFSGGSNNNATAIGAAPSFNFSQQSQQNVQNPQNQQQNAAVQMQGNLFNMGPSNGAGAGGRRPIRTATRRLK